MVPFCPGPVSARPPARHRRLRRSQPVWQNRPVGRVAVRPGGWRSRVHRAGPSARAARVAAAPRARSNGTLGARDSVASVASLLSRAGLVALASLVTLAAVLLQPRGAGATSPPLPAGTTVVGGLAPHVYPGGGLLPFGDAAAPPALTGSSNSLMVAAAASPSGQGLWLFGA